MNPQLDVTVAPNPSAPGWIVREHGHVEPVSLHRTKQGAIEIGLSLATYRGCALRVRERDGKVRTVIEAEAGATLRKPVEAWESVPPLAWLGPPATKCAS
jgi:hypothetical protein